MLFPAKFSRSSQPTLIGGLFYFQLLCIFEVHKNQTKFMKPKHAALTATIALVLFISWISGAMIAPPNISIYIIFIPAILFVIIWLWCDVYKSLRKISEEDNLND